MFALPPPRFMPCPDCGASVDRAAGRPHVCDEDRRVEYELFHLRGGVERFEDELTAWLASPVGRFEAFYASYRRHTDR
jgi:hypothetical protein